MDSQGLHVIIVGGAITGLTMALCLERLDIPYTLLEKHDAISPPIGGSLALCTNGAQVLDQLGVWDDIESEMNAFDTVDMRIGDDFSYTLHYARDLRKLLHYPLGMMSRYKLLDILLDAVKHKEWIHCGAKVERIIDDVPNSRVRVIDSKGREYQGSLVVGADGISSSVRGDMLAKLNKGKEQSVICEHACVFGTSTNVPNASKGLQIRSEKGLTLFAESLKDNDVFWMAFIKLGQKHQYPHRLKFSKEEAINIARPLVDKKIDDKLAFGDVWSRAIDFDMVPIEEGVFDNWSSGRVICIGDAVHKVSPNTGQGANIAIEDVAGLANMLHDLRAQNVPGGDKGMATEIVQRLKDFEKAAKVRTRGWDRLSRWVIRMHAHDGMLRTWANSYAMPLMDPWLARLTSTLLTNGTKLDFLPPSARMIAAAKGKGSKMTEGELMKFILRLTVAIYLFFYAIRIFSSYF